MNESVKNSSLWSYKIYGDHKSNRDLQISWYYEAFGEKPKAFLLFKIYVHVV